MTSDLCIYLSEAWGCNPFTSFGDITLWSLTCAFTYEKHGFCNPISSFSDLTLWPLTCVYFLQGSKLVTSDLCIYVYEAWGRKPPSNMKRVISDRLTHRSSRLMLRWSLTRQLLRIDGTKSSHEPKDPVRVNILPEWRIWIWSIFFFKQKVSETKKNSVDKWRG